MAAAAQIVEGMGADIVDVNMGCPVPKIAKHNAGCSLMREPAHAADVVRAMARAVRIPVTVKMRAGWDASEINAPDLARRMEDAGAAARRGARPDGRAVVFRVVGLGFDREGCAMACRFRSLAAATASIPSRSSSGSGRGVAGVLVGRGALRNPWIFEQAADLARARAARRLRGRARPVPARLHRAAHEGARRRGRRASVTSRPVRRRRSGRARRAGTIDG